MATEVGAAYVRLLPSMRGFTAEAASGLKKSLESAGRDAGDKGGDAAGKGFAGKFQQRMSGMAGTVGRILGKTGKILGGVGVAAAGIVGALGIKRLIGLENANKSFKQMGLNVKQTDKLMDGLLKSLRGTPYALNEGAGAMAALVSAGAPLKKVNKYMDLIADSAAFAQKPMGEVARVFQKIQSQGKIQGDEIMSLAEQGLPAFQILSKGMGKSVDEVRKVIKKGEFTADDFFAAWEKGSKGFGDQNIKIAGAAKSAGDTTSGAFANMRAAAGRMGEALLGKPFANTKNFFNTVTGLIDTATIKLKPFVNQFWDLAAATGDKLKPIALSFTTDTKNFLAGVDWAGMGSAVQEKAKELGNPMIAGWKSGVETGNWSNFGQSLGSGLGTAFENITMGGIDLGGKIAELVKGIDWFDVGKGVGKTAIGFLIGFTVGLLQTDIVGILGKLWENKWGTLLGLLMLVPIGRGVGLIGKFLTKIPWLRVFAPIFTKGGAALEKVGGLLWKGIGKLGGRVLAAFTRAFPNAGGALTRFFSKLPGKANEKLNQLAITVVTKLRGLTGRIGGFAGKMLDKGLDLMFALIKGVGRGIGGIGKVVGRIPGKFWGVISGLIGSMLQWGGDAVQGFINGIVNKAKDLPGIVKDGIVGGVKAGLGKLKFGSPSKLMETYGEWTTAGFVKGLKGGAKDIREEMSGLMEQLKKDGKKGAIAAVKAVADKLVIKAKKKEAVLERLEIWKEKLQELKDELKSFKDGINSSFTAMGDVTQFEVNNFGELTGFMKIAQQQAADWASTVKQLSALGLKREAIDQLLAAGPETAMKNAQLILAQGKSGVDQINGFMDQIQASGSGLANTLGSQFYDAGIAAAQGMINGLKAKNSALADAMVSLAKQVVKQLKKELGIKSPSRVFFGLGQMVPAGFAGGIDRGALEVSNSISRMVTTPELSSTYTNALPSWQASLDSRVAGRSLGANSEPMAKIMISADGLNRALLEWLREAIRVEGGNVQKVLGKGNGN